MAKRRMLSIELCTSDNFLTLTEEARELYFYINLYADDDGFVGNAQTVARIIGISEKHLAELCEKNYLIRFPSGVYVVRHWCVHNQIRKDRHNPTQYVKEARTIEIEDRIYVLKDEKKEEEKSVFSGNRLATQISSDERSEDELKEEKKRENKNNPGEFRQSGGDNANVENSVESLMLLSEEDNMEEDDDTEAYLDSLSAAEKAEYRRLVSKIQLFFLSNNKIKESDEFIAYNNKRRWRGISGESVKDDLTRYMKGWLKYGREYYGQLS